MFLSAIQTTTVLTASFPVVWFPAGRVVSTRSPNEDPQTAKINAQVYRHAPSGSNESKFIARSRRFWQKPYTHSLHNKVSQNNKRRVQIKPKILREIEHTFGKFSKNRPVRTLVYVEQKNLTASSLELCFNSFEKKSLLINQKRPLLLLLKARSLSSKRPFLTNEDGCSTR